MTVTDLALDSARAALEVEHVESHLHPVSSFDPADHPLPTGREEIWRFTPLKRLRGALDDTPCDENAVSIEVSDGQFLAEKLAVGQSPRGEALVPGDRASAVASKNSLSATHLRIPAGMTVEAPIRLDITAHDGLRSNVHVVVEALAESTATLLITHTGSGVVDANVEILVGDRATLTVVVVHDWAADTVHLATHEALVGRDAVYKHIQVSLGGDLIRTNSNASFSGPGGNAELLGVYFADAGQHIEHRLFVDHDQPRTVSHADYRGALQGHGAHTVWVGNVLIRKNAQGIETYESNKNLVLTDGCQADSVPNLEIETGDIVGAGHSSTTGRFDDEQLFYLRSRGISESEARKLVVRGFFAHLVNRIGIADVERHLMDTIDVELARSVEASA